MIGLLLALAASAGSASKGPIYLDCAIDHQQVNGVSVPSSKNAIWHFALSEANETATVTTDGGEAWDTGQVRASFSAKTVQFGYFEVDRVNLSFVHGVHLGETSSAIVMMDTGHCQLVKPPANRAF